MVSWQLDGFGATTERVLLCSLHDNAQVCVLGISANILTAGGKPKSDPEIGKLQTKTWWQSI